MRQFDTFEDFIFPHLIMYLASPVFLCWVLYEEFIKKDS